MKKNIIIIILTIIILCLGGYLVYDNVIEKNNNVDNEIIGNDQNNEENNPEDKKIEAYKYVDNAFSGIAVFDVSDSYTSCGFNSNNNVYKIMIPKILKESSVTKIINDKIYNENINYINKIKTKQSQDTVDGNLEIFYDYTIKDNILFIKLTKSGSVNCGGGYLYHSVYYYDITNDKELTVQEICNKFNILKTDIKDKSIKEIYAVMPKGNSFEIFYNQDEPCPNLGCQGSEIITKF